jgi:NagD protein
MSDGQKRVAARLSRSKGFILDMDGTLVLGDKRNKRLKALPGAAAFLSHLRKKKVPFVLFTNGTVRPPRDYVDELAHAGLNVEAERIMTPASVAADYLSAKKYRRVLVLGGEGVGRPLAEAGIEVIRPPRRDPVDAIFVGWFREFGMSDIEVACEAAWSGARVFAASLVPYFASADGRTLGTSCAIAGAIDKITGSRTMALGKPSSVAMRVACRKLGVAPQEVAIIGDDPNLEIPMALQGGALAIGVTSGVAKQKDYDAAPRAARAHVVAENVGAVLDLWRRHSN